MELYIKGNFKRSIFNGDNGYVVGLFKIKEACDEFRELTNKTVTFTGYFHELNENDTYIMYGDFSIHKKYGEQFVVNRYDRVKPEEKDSIVEFLSSGLFKGIGKKKAIKIVEVLGSETFNVILNNPDNLLLIPTITKKQADILHNTLLEYEASYNTILKLGDMGFNTRDSMLIYNKYKENTISVCDRDIYNVYYDIREISFKAVDKIALSIGYINDDKRRISAAIYYVFVELTNSTGDSYFLIDNIFLYTKKVLGFALSDEDFIDGLNFLIINLKIVKNDFKYYLKEIYDAEELIAKRMKFLVRLPDIKYKNLDKYINQLEMFNNFSYDDNQRLAIKEAISKSILVVTGGPGSGKTTIIKSIVDLYRDLNKLTYDDMSSRLALLAPTGRASKRLSEATLFPSTTIHRFLKWNKESNKFSVNEYNKSKVDFVIIDEVSMIDTSLLMNLFKGLKVDTKIILVGDYNQLPSVGSGQILKDVIDSEMIPTITLNKLHRQSEGSNIIDLAYDFNLGSLNLEVFNSGSDLEYIESFNIAKDIKEVCVRYKDTDYKDFQVLVPMYKTIDGIDRLNVILQEIFNPASKTKNEILVDGVIYRENDKVLQLTNMPDDNIFNGDIGVIYSIEKNNIIIDFDGNLVKFSPSNFKNFKHAYAISIHKSQGSEFDNVLIPLSKSYGKMLYRKLYYTAITRSKKKLILLGDIKALEYASFNNSSLQRNTTLKDKLIEKIKINE